MLHDEFDSIAPHAAAIAVESVFARAYHEARGFFLVERAACAVVAPCSFEVDVAAYDFDDIDLLFEILDGLGGYHGMPFLPYSSK